MSLPGTIKFSNGSSPTLTSTASSPGTYILTAGNPAIVVTGTWTKVSGPGTITFSNANSPTSMATASVAGEYTLRWTITGGSCPSSDDVNITYTPGPTATVTGGGTICAGNSSTVTVTVTGGTAPYTVTLDNGGGTQSGSSPLTFSVFPEDWSTTYSVESGTDALGSCITGSGSATVTVSPDFPAYAGPDQTVCGLLARLEGYSEGEPRPGTWPRMSLPGTIKFRNVNSEASMATASVAGKYTLPAGNPAIVVTGTWTKVSGPGTITFSNANSPTSTATASSPGAYTLRWTIAGGSCPSSDDVNITYTPGPTATVTGGGTICLESISTVTVTVTVTGGTAPYTVTLDNDGGRQTGPSPLSFEVETPSTTTYSVESGEDALGCTITSSGSATVTVILTTVNAGPDQTICAGTSVVLAGSLTGGATGPIWTGGGGIFVPNATTLNAIYTPSDEEIAEGITALTLRRDNLPGVCGPINDTMFIIINPVTVHAGPDQTICAGTSAILAGSCGYQANGTWSGGTGTFSPNATTRDAVYTPSAAERTAGTVTLTFTMDDPPAACGPNSDTMTITINPTANANAGPDQTICAGTSATLAGSFDGIAYGSEWIGGGGTFIPSATTLNAVYTPSSAEITAGSVTLTLLNPVGPCPGAVDSMTIFIDSCLPHIALLVADTANNRIQGFDGSNWSVIGVGTLGAGNGQFRAPEAVAFSSTGQRMYVADTGNNRIQWSTDGGVNWANFATNGVGFNQVKAPQGVALDAAGNLYVADTGNNRILRFNGGIPGMGVLLANKGTSAGQVTNPSGMVVDNKSTLFIADTGNNRVLKILNASTVISTNTGKVVASNGIGLNQVRAPQGVAVDSNGTLYIADTGNSRILRFLNGNSNNATTLALSGTQLGQVRQPEGITTSQFTSGWLAGIPIIVVGDTANNRIVGRPIGTGSWLYIGSPDNVGTGIGQFRAPSKIR
ncbi:MAG: NHL repeat-containing protein [Acidobacteria bacterium]|nr:NHL repeat-containing protein [Acidobacteriota bacterium]